MKASLALSHHGRTERALGGEEVIEKILKQLNLFRLN